MKTLQIIQTLSKIGKIISKIVYICCIIGFCGCAVGVVAMLIGEESLKIGGVTLHSILQTEAGIGIGTVWAAIFVGMILCAGEIVVAKLTCNYFDHELEAGTPFTAEGAKELLLLGVHTIWIPIVAAVLAQVARDIIYNIWDNVEQLKMESSDSVALGVMFIVASLLCRYGAEVKGEKK